MILKCKICGGDIELSQDKTIGICEYCGKTITFPKIDEEQKIEEFNRGNAFRRIGEFDKALSIYEHIVQEDKYDAEAHWCCALCRYGIEYVEDPTNYEWIPTCHRASFDSFLDDVDYLAAVKYSDGLAQRQYQKDAVQITNVQRSILTTIQNEKPFDIFICYKETDEMGIRTQDSVLAQEIYYQLNNLGYRTFFSRITMEEKAGSQYEPYIFAALNSAKIMITIGTKVEHLNAVWVRNEWSRFLAMMKKDSSKLLLPCYKDLDPYSMPSALSMLQSYDMGKIGFMQDLIHGIQKVLHRDSTVQAENSFTTVDTYLKNAITFLKLEQNDKALEIYKSLTDNYPDDYRAWWELARYYSDDFSNAYNCGQIDYEMICQYAKSSITVADPSIQNEYKKILEKYKRTYELTNGNFENIHLVSIEEKNEISNNLFAIGKECLEAGNSKEAYQRFSRYLQIVPNSAKAYWGELLAQRECKNNNELVQQKMCIEQEALYQKACLHGDSAQKEEYKRIAEKIRENCTQEKDKIITEYIQATVNKDKKIGDIDYKIREKTQSILDLEKASRRKDSKALIMIVGTIVVYYLFMAFITLDKYGYHIESLSFTDFWLPSTILGIVIILVIGFIFLKLEGDSNSGTFDINRVILEKELEKLQKEKAAIYSDKSNRHDAEEKLKQLCIPELDVKKALYIADKRDKV